MADTAPPQLLTMRKNTGTLEAPGAADNPVIIGFATFIGDRFPRMKKYSASYTHDSIAWCGLAVAYAMAANGIEPPYDPTDDLKSYLWAMSWVDWGAPADKPQLGDVLVFAFGGDDHHVTMYDGDADATHYLCIGGNQSDSIKVSSYLKSQCIAMRRAPAPAVITAPIAIPASVSMTAATSMFAEALKHLLVYEGGNDDDPRDPGGRTSRGILQREWDVWRTTHPGLPSDVWQAPDDQVAAIYRQNYWDALCCDQLPAGVNFAVFDYGVNSGIARSAKALQSFVETEVDGEVGPDTIAASCKADPATLIGQICDQRIAFLKGLPTWGTFGKGWTNRVTDVRKTALAMGTAAPITRAAPVSPPAPTLPTATDPTIILIQRRLDRLENQMSSTSAQVKADARTTSTTAPPPTQLPAFDLKSIEGMIASIQQQLPTIEQRITGLSQILATVTGGKLPALTLPVTSGTPIALPSAADAVAPPTALTSKAGLGAGVIGVIASLIASQAGVIGMPVGEAATTTGAVLPLLSAGVGVLGAAGKLAPLLRGLMLVL